MGLRLAVESLSATATLIPIMADDASGVLLFVYTGLGEGAIVPRDVVRVLIDPSVLEIPANTFFKRHQLKEVVFHDNICKIIGPAAFSGCLELTEIELL